MRTIQSGHDVLSLFGILTKTQAPTKKISDHSLLKSLAGAFLIVLLAGLLLGLVQRVLTADATGSASAILDYNESVAYIPGQFVSNQINQISQGYVGR